MSKIHFISRDYLEFLGGRTPLAPSCVTMASLQQHPWLAFEQFTTPDAAIEHAKVNLSSADVPLLDGVSPQELHAYVGQVVRWTLMVQDTTLGSEVYAKRTSKHKQSLLFRESLDVDDEPDFKDLGERTGCFCVSRAAFDHSYQHLVGPT